jgi:hypothetical protein
VAVVPNLLRLTCRRCGKPLKASGDLAGRPGKCPRCGEVFVVPARDAASGVANRLGMGDRNGVPSAVRAGSRVLSVLESLIGPVPYGMAAWARWHESSAGRTGIVRRGLGALGLGGPSEESETNQHLGCIALRDESLYLLDFGCGRCEDAAFERYLFDLVRHGIAPAVVTSPRSLLTVRILLETSRKAILLCGALRLCVYPGIGSAFPAPLLSALSPGP